MRLESKTNRRVTFGSLRPRYTLPSGTHATLLEYGAGGAAEARLASGWPAQPPVAASHTQSHATHACAATNHSFTVQMHKQS